MITERPGLWAGCVFLLLAFAASAQGFESAEVNSVLDGATIVLTSGEVVGYAGVKIPEAEVGNSERAAAFNKSLVAGADVRLEYDVEKRDAAGRLLAYVYVGRLFVNKELVDLGFAEVDTETRSIKYRKLFFRAQKEAFERRRGLWAERFGEEGAERAEAPEMPELKVAEAAAAAGLPVPLPDEERPFGAVDLAFRLFIGDVLTYRGTLTRTLAFAGEEVQREDSVDLAVEVVWTIEDVDAKGGAIIRQEIAGIEASAISDSISQEDVERMAQFAGRSVTTVLDGKGYVVRVDGIEQLLEEAPPAFHSLLRGIFWRETPLAGQAVGLGDFWWVERTTPFFGDGTQVKLSMDAKCMVTDFAQVGEYGCAEVYMEGTLGLRGAGAEGSEPAGAAEGEMRTTFYVAYDEGLVARSEGESEVVFTPSALEGAPGRVVVTERSEFVVQEIRRGENYVAPGAVPTEAVRTAYVARDVVNLRGAATTRSRVLGRLERGQKLTVLARKGDWYKVKYSYPVWGWISAKLVEGELSEDLLVQILEEAEGWEEPSAAVAEATTPPEIREKEVFYAEVEQALREQEIAAAAGGVPEGMVYVPAGGFLMGSDAGEASASPEHEVVVDGFYIDRCEVTNREFQALRPDFAFPEGQESHPVSGVSWEDANAYCEWAGKRLPTEAEWEKAARGTDGLTYPWGNEFDSGRVNTEEAEKKGTVPVGQYSAGASPYGAYDMAGNAAEWTASWYAAYPGNSSADPDYGEAFKALRGGSWFTPKEQATTFARLHDNPNSQRAYYGFRCAIAPQQLAALAEKEAREEALAAAEEEIEPIPALPVEEVPEGLVGKVLFKARKLFDRVKGLVGR